MTTKLGLSERCVVGLEIDFAAHPRGGDSLDESQITEYIQSEFEGVDVVVASQANGAPEIAWGDSFFIYDPHRDLPDTRRFPFATMVTKDYTGFDEQSKLNRPGVFRLNVGVSKETFDRLFGSHENYDFTALDVLMAHPLYGVNHFVCILNPSEETFASVKPLLAEAYSIAVRRATRPSRSRSSR
jgi:hypothetical protein